MVEHQTKGLVTLQDYRESGRTDIFPSPASLQWFIRCNKSALIERKALLMPTGRKLINPVAFDQVVIDVGHFIAQRRLACNP